MTVAVTLFALLELYKQGEATWHQAEPFGEIAIEPLRSDGPTQGCRHERAGPDPRGAAVPVARAGQRRRAGRGARQCTPDELREALDELRERFAPGARGLELREVAGGFTLTSAPDTEAAARRLLAKPRTPPLTPGAGRDAGDRRLPGAGLAARDHADPRRQRRLGRVDAARARADRGGRPLAVRRGPVPHDAAVPQAVRPATRSTTCPTRGQWDPTPDEEADLRERLLRAGDARAGVPDQPAPRCRLSEPSVASARRGRRRLVPGSWQRAEAGAGRWWRALFGVSAR